MKHNTHRIDYTKYPLPRIRHHANSVMYFPLKQHKSKKFIYPPLIQTMDWKEVFADGKAAKYLDVGCGLGKFTAEMAVQNPKLNILAFEVRSGAVDWTNKVLAGEKIQNAKAIWYSAVNGFPFIKSGSIEKVFYFFPDPWVKKRHHKRRAFSTELLDEFSRVLKPKGALYLMTDVPEVDEYQQEILSEHNGFSYSYVAPDDWDLGVQTYQEDFCIRKQIPFIRMICKNGRKTK